jgi:hypothetical protein
MNLNPMDLNLTMGDEAMKRDWLCLDLQDAENALRGRPVY